jgi:gliding motility-associated transport system ATP-binding protein
MIEMSGLTKTYGGVTALDHADVSIQTGEVVGLLGPNGAGKTTMLKLLTGYLPPTEGTARVADLDILTHGLDVRRRIGYLPESNPLYDEMTVWESLQWAARLREIPVERQASAMESVIVSCGLQAALGKDIGELSKGYRQRVGLAQAILHDPEILILDEPTSGLDPNQQQEVRQLIQNLRQKKTVLLSTHILSEAQSSCDRVLIIHRGKIVADGTPELLSRQMTRGYKLTLELKAPADRAEAALAGLPGADHVQRLGDSEGRSLFMIESGTMDLRHVVFDLVVRERWPILQMTPEVISLEDVFRQLTMTVENAGKRVEGMDP